MFFQQLHVGNRHAPVNGFAHVVDGEQGDLDGGEGFHFDAGGADGLYRGGAGDAGHAGGRVDGAGLKLDGDTGQRQRVAQGNEVAGFFGGHDAGDAGNAEHVAFFGGARLNDGQCGGQHFNAAAGNPEGCSGMKRCAVDPF